MLTMQRVCEDDMEGSGRQHTKTQFNNFVDIQESDASPVHPTLNKDMVNFGEQDRSMEENPERVTTPELTTPVMNTEDVVGSSRIMVAGSGQHTLT